MKKCANPMTSLENLSKNITGFKGYEQQEDREISDNAFREFLIDQTKTLIKAFGQKLDVNDAEYRIVVDERIQSKKRNLLTISQSLKTPTYEGTPFFTKGGLPEQLINSIYEHECRMLEEIKNISDEIAAVLAPGNDKEVFEDHFLHIQDFIDALNQYLFERESLILGEF